MTTMNFDEETTRHRASIPPASTSGAPLVGAWQTALRADFAALAAKNACAPLLNNGSSQITLAKVQRAHALTAAGEPNEGPKAQFANTANFLLMALPPRTQLPGADVRLLAAVTQGQEHDQVSAVAGLIVLDELAARFRDRAHWDVQGGGLARTLSRSLAAAHRRVLEVSTSNARFDPHWTFERPKTLVSRDRNLFRGLTTTVTVAAVTGRVATIAHIGSPAALLVRGDDVERITPDHSVSALPGFRDVVTNDADRINFGDLSRCTIGREREVHVETRSQQLRNGDSLLLSTGALAQSLESDVEATVAACAERDLELQAQKLSYLADGPASATARRHRARDLALVVIRGPQDETAAPLSSSQTRRDGH